MQIKRQTDQAIRILVHLSNRRQIMVGKELAGLVGASAKYMPYIMQQLRRAGLVTSTSGICGGYVLAKSPKDISLYDVMIATGDEPWISCYVAGEQENHPFGKADVLQKHYDSIHELVRKYFSAISISDLCKPEQINNFYSGMEQNFAI